MIISVIRGFRHLCLLTLVVAAAQGSNHEVRFDGRGFTIEPEGAGWQWGLELEGVKGPAQVRTEGARTTYEWDSTLEEWFVNDEHGLEHGFTLKQDGLQPVWGLSPALELKVRGGLHPRVHPDQLGADFLDSAGRSLIQYAGLKSLGRRRQDPTRSPPSRGKRSSPPSGRDRRPLPHHD